MARSHLGRHALQHDVDGDLSGAGWRDRRAVAGQPRVTHRKRNLTDGESASPHASRHIYEEIAIQETDTFVNTTRWGDEAYHRDQRR